MGDDKQLKFEAEIQPIAKAKILLIPPDDLSAEEAVEAFAIVKYVQKRLDDRKDELRKRILDDESIIKEGKGTPAGGTNTNVNGNKVSRRKTTKPYANTDAIKSLLAEKGLEESEVFDDVTKIVTSQVVNPSKIQRLVELGAISEEEEKELHKVTWTLVVKPSDTLNSALRTSSQPKLLSFTENDE